MSQYKAGKTYILQTNVKVRAGAGINTPQKYYKDLTPKGKANAFEQLFAVMKANTKIIAIKIIENGNQIWIKTPDGFLCAKNGKEIYIC